LDFLGPWLFRFENPRFRGLDFLGFPWILSSESRLINGLHGIFVEKFFVALFAPWGVEAAEEGRRPGCAESQKWSSRKLNLDSDFCNELLRRLFAVSDDSRQSRRNGS
jgi:hypothetical protein